MPQRQQYEALVLRTFDVGEADRFCILFTRERGKIAARVRSVRKLNSKMGGYLLPFRQVCIELTETSSGFLITSASNVGTDVRLCHDLLSFSRLEQGIELLLCLTEDDHPLPEVFELLVQFLTLCRDNKRDVLLPFQLKLLQVLGVLPARQEEEAFRRLHRENRTFLEACGTVHDLALLSCVPREESELHVFCTAVLTDHLTRPLKAEGVGAALVGER